ncbi:hypothetical protein Tco_0730181 [Tanacetum coccineum]|uniref:Uncharacterized protein n=1 Tax=Tanacetum coccineum TaxID=301880 RepID=A0ABQ4YS10_9ASTR
MNGRCLLQTDRPIGGSADGLSITGSVDGSQDLGPRPTRDWVILWHVIVKFNPKMPSDNVAQTHKLGTPSSGPANAIARRAIDEISEFSGETETPKYMKEAQAVMSSLAQVRAMVAEMEAANDPDEHYDSLRCLRGSWRIGEDKLRGLNETIAAAEDEISTLESHLEIMDAAINSDD